MTPANHRWMRYLAGCGQVSESSNKMTGFRGDHEVGEDAMRCMNSGWGLANPCMPCVWGPMDEAGL